MASPFKDLDDFFVIRPHQLPIRGKTYEFPGTVSGRTGLMLHRMTEVAEQVRQGKKPNPDDMVLDDAGEVDLRAEVFGEGGEQELIADGLPAAYIEHVLHTLIVWHQFGEDVAAAVWADVPGAPKVKPRDRKPKSRKATSGSASTTRRRASSTPTSGSGQESSGSESSSSGD